MIGRVLAHYKIVSSLGKGGMGEVYVAEDTKLGRRVALKMLPEEMATDPERRARFEREARAVAALSHPNIVTVHSVDEADGVHFITMELIEGKTLAKILPKNGFALSELLEIAIPLADAVSSAHRTGITHRDLKPDNIMIDGEGRLRVLDFGLAKLHDPAGGEEGLTEAPTATLETEEGKILGTVTYMSPEQAEGKAVDPRSDVFSLGTILYEMATGERPFQGDTSMSTIGAILKDQPTSVTELNPLLPRHLGRIIRRCLAKDPDRRYQTALDLRNELEELKAEIDSGELAAGPGLAAARPRRSLRTLGVLGAVLVLAVVAIVMITSRKDAESPRAVYTSRPITGTIGQEMSINWSPESVFMAFAQIREGSVDVMVQPVTGGEAVLRAGGPGSETSPHWSPDGKYLAYVSSSEPGTPVFLVPSHGGAPRKLISTNIRTLDLATIGSAMGDHPWSADSKDLLVSRADASGKTAIYRVDRDTGDAEQLTFPTPGRVDLSPSYSYDGERIVFQRRSNGKGALLMMPAAGGDPQVLLADEFDNTSPAWRPDNRHVLFLSDRRGSSGSDVFEIDVTGGLPRQLTFETNRVFSVSVSADNRVAYSPFWHDTFLFTVDVSSGERRQLNSHSKDNFGARFSPDGRSVAYHSTRTGNSEVWLNHLDGRPETQITDNGSWDLYPDWSPDGERMIFVSDRDGGLFKIFIANSDGGGERLLVDKPITLDSQYAPVIGALVSRWSPDGELIAFLAEGEGNTALWTVGADGEGARRVLENATGFDWYLDSRHGIFSRHHGSESEMVAIDLETGQEQSLFVGPFIELDVAPDGSAVAFCFGQGHMAMGLAVLELEPPSDPEGLPRAVGEPEYVVRTEGTWHAHNGGWSADSKQLVYTRDMDYGDIFELVERR
jgi:Tol biopolymer transport system component/predicted Ser/Thr protein kinase